MRKNRSPIFPIVFFFIITTGFFVSSKKFFARYGFDQEVLLIGNLVLFVVTSSSFIIGKRNLRSSNPNAFVRGVYLSTMLKLFACAIAAFVYIMMFRKNISKPALIACMGLYIIYTILEVSVLKKLLKKNA
jgi:ACR3 family arsenite efflux pump ArsB